MYASNATEHFKVINGTGEKAKNDYVGYHIWKYLHFGQMTQQSKYSLPKSNN